MNEGFEFAYKNEYTNQLRFHNKLIGCPFSSKILSLRRGCKEL